MMLSLEVEILADHPGCRCGKRRGRGKGKQRRLPSQAPSMIAFRRGEQRRLGGIFGCRPGVLSGIGEAPLELVGTEDWSIGN